jgi:hypothetical protein
MGVGTAMIAASATREVAGLVQLLHLLRGDVFDVGPALVDAIDSCPGGIDADDVMAGLRERAGQWEPDIAQTNDDDGGFAVGESLEKSARSLFGHDKPRFWVDLRLRKDRP